MGPRATCAPLSDVENGAVDAELQAALERREKLKRDRLVAFLARPGVQRFAIGDAPERSWP